MDRYYGPQLRTAKTREDVENIVATAKDEFCQLSRRSKVKVTPNTLNWIGKDGAKEVAA